MTIPEVPKVALDHFLGGQVPSAANPKEALEVRRTNEAERDKKLRGIFRTAIALTPMHDGITSVSVRVPDPRNEAISYFITRIAGQKRINGEDVTATEVSFGKTIRSTDRTGRIHDPLEPVATFTMAGDVYDNGELRREVITYPQPLTHNEILDPEMETIEEVIEFFKGSLNPENRSMYERETARQELQSRKRHAYYDIEGHLGEITKGVDAKGELASRNVSFRDWTIELEREAAVTIARSQQDSEAEGAAQIALDEVLADSLYYRHETNPLQYAQERDFVARSKLIAAILETETDLIQFEDTPPERWKEWGSTGVDMPGTVDAKPNEEVTARASINMARNLRKLQEDIEVGTVVPNKKSTTTTS